VEKILISTISRLLYDDAGPSTLSTIRKLRLATANKMSADVIKAWLEKQDAYTLHRPVRERFASNPYTVSNVMDVWECDLMDVRVYVNYNDNYRYILSVIGVFSKCLNLIPQGQRAGFLSLRRFVHIR